MVSPVGSGIPVFWDAVLACRVGTRQLRRFDTSQLQTGQGGEVESFEALEYAGVPLATQFATTAAKMCLQDAALTSRERHGIGVALGTVSGPRPHIENGNGAAQGERGREDQRAGNISRSAGSLSSAVARELHLTGPNVTTATACAAGNTAIAWAVDCLQRGRAQAMIAGGSDQLSSTMLMLFSQLRSLAPDCVRPFDKDRAGLLLSEGAGALMLETREHAEQRGARVYCDVAGFSVMNDCFHMTAPHPEGVGAARAMRCALSMAGMQPQDVGYISAHGTGTKSNDLAESRAINRVFGHRRGPAVTALKSTIGHTQGAAAAIQAVACVLSLRDEIVPATANLRCLDPQCDIDLVMDPRKLSRPVVVSNAFGFGGNICCLVLRKVG